MADSRQRAPLQSSFSFSIPSAGDLSSRSLKRRFSTPALDPGYFTPSATTFRPRPYQPQLPQEAQQPQLQPQPQRPQHSQESTQPFANAASSARSNLTRTHSLGVNAVNNDPDLNDPETVIIHAPFTDFPDADKYKEGLTYNLLAANPKWYLDEADFISTASNPNPSAIRYPSQLEPPRGWCPARRKDLKDGWPEGEEPRLRCTFCNRAYAGVNAKSMWRRHVYEKHKIAMSNRRDNQDRKGGRGSNKENRDKENARTSGRGSRRTSRGVEQGPSRIERSPSNASEWKRPSMSGADWPRHDEEWDDDNGQVDEPLPQLLHDENSGPEGEPDFFQAIKSSSTPPLTPGFSPTKSAWHFNRAHLLESPYDPLVTPSFRHSPARLPSDQPWRFPSPSHPLHSRAKELSLGMLVRGEASPVVSGLDVSPLVILPASERGKRSVFSSPSAPLGKDRENIFFPEPSPRRLFYDGPIPVPDTDRADFKEYRIPESPLGRPSRRPQKRSMTSLTEAIQSWQSEIPHSAPINDGPGLLGPIELQGEDPFVDSLYNSWVDLSGATEESPRQQSPRQQSSRQQSPPRPIPDESPVAHSSQSSSSNGVTRSNPVLSIGMGLMDAVLSAKARPQSRTDSSDSDDQMTGRFTGSPVHAGKKTRRGFMVGWPRNDDGDTEMSGAQPKKRRKTISGRN